MPRSESAYDECGAALATESDSGLDYAFVSDHKLIQRELLLPLPTGESPPKRLVTCLQSVHHP